MVIGGRAPIPWTRVAPLLTTGWVDGATATGVLFDADVLAILRAAVRSIVRRRSDLDGLELEDIVNEVLLLVARRAGIWVAEPTASDEADRRSGLTPSSDPPFSADPWLWTVFANAARDVLRSRARDAARRPVDDPEDGDASQRRELSDGGEVAANVVRGLDVSKVRPALTAAIRDGRMRPVHGLAWEMQIVGVPKDDVVDAAVADSQDGNGVARARGDLGALLPVWGEAWESGLGGQLERLALAWVLRTVEALGPDGLEATAKVWRVRDPDAADRARDAVRQWGNRAARVLREAMSVSGGQP